MIDNLSYDQAMARIEAIVNELEHTEALSVAIYKQKAAEAQKLIRFCEAQLRNMEEELKDANH